MMANWISSAGDGMGDNANMTVIQASWFAMGDGVAVSGPPCVRGA
jgi:hypothetical protein